MRGTKRRIECCCGPELDERVAVTSTLLKHDAEIVMNEGAIAASGEHRAERRFRTIEIVRLERVHPLSKTLGQLWREILC